MGIGGGIFLIALGAVLAFAIQVNPWWIDLRATGVIVMLAGAAVVLVTLWYWQDRRRRAAAAAEPRLPPPE
ncbi:DUF6458 family protein [Phytohabitans kaempferiae]|uniref:DUF6458 family protein n=1 Tax=Phytohabitans kaempferiae TaxID=1620943 RepID=A0ABV6MA11_9ACTN